MPGDDYYSILNLQRNATENDIKKAYHKMAMKWHPDKNQDDKERAERKFKEISEAYQVLSDKEKRAIYDRHGREGLRGVPAAEPNFTGRSRARDYDYDRTWTDDRRQGPRQHGSHAFTRSYNGDGSRPSYYFVFRSPEEVFAEFFGGRDPFLDVHDIFSSSYVADPFGRRGDSQARDHSRQRQRNSSNVNEVSRRSRDGATTNVNIQDEFRRVFGADDFAFGDSSSWNATFPERLNPASAKKFTSTTTSTKNGRKVVTRRVVENGVETVTVEENGVVKDRQVLRGPELL